MWLYCLFPLNGACMRCTLNGECLLSSKLYHQNRRVVLKKKRLPPKVSKAQHLLKTAKITKKASGYIDNKLYCFNCKRVKKKTAIYNFPACSKCETYVTRLLSKPVVLCSNNKDCEFHKDRGIACEACLLKLCRELDENCYGPEVIAGSFVVVERIGDIFPPSNSQGDSPVSQSTVSTDDQQPCAKMLTVTNDNCDSGLTLHTTLDLKTFIMKRELPGVSISKEQLKDYVFLNPEKFFTFMRKCKNQIQNESKSLTFKEESDQAETLCHFLNNTSTLKPVTMKSNSKSIDIADMCKNKEMTKSDNWDEGIDKIETRMDINSPVEEFSQYTPNHLEADSAENNVFGIPDAYQTENTLFFNKEDLEDSRFGPTTMSNFQNGEIHSNKSIVQDLNEAENLGNFDTFCDFNSRQENTTTILSPVFDPIHIEYYIPDDILNSSLSVSHSVYEPITPEDFGNTSCTSVRVVPSKSENNLKDSQFIDQLTVPQAIIDSTLCNLKSSSPSPLKLARDIIPISAKSMNSSLNLELMPIPSESGNLHMYRLNGELSNPDSSPTSENQGPTDESQSCENTQTISDDKCDTICENEVNLEVPPQTSPKFSTKVDKVLKKTRKTQSGRLLKRIEVNKPKNLTTGSISGPVVEKDSLNKDLLSTGINPNKVLSPTVFKIPKLSVKTHEHAINSFELLNEQPCISHVVSEDKPMKLCKKKKRKRSSSHKSDSCQEQCFTTANKNSISDSRKEFNSDKIHSFNFASNFTITYSTNKDKEGSSRSVTETKSTIMEENDTAPHSDISINADGSTTYNPIINNYDVELDYEPDTTEQPTEHGLDITEKAAEHDEKIEDPPVTLAEICSYGRPTAVALSNEIPQMHVTYSQFEDIADPNIDILSSKINPATSVNYANEKRLRTIKREPPEELSEEEYLSGAEGGDLVVHPGEELIQFLADNNERIQDSKVIEEPLPTLVETNIERTSPEIVISSNSKLHDSFSVPTPSKLALSEPEMIPEPIVNVADVCPEDICQSFLATGFCSLKCCPQVHSKTNVKIMKQVSVYERLQQELEEGHLNKAVSFFVQSAKCFSRHEVRTYAELLIENIFRFSQFTHIKVVVNGIVSRGNPIADEAILNTIIKCCEPYIKIPIIKECLCIIYKIAENCIQIKLLTAESFNVIMKCICIQQNFNLVNLVKTLHLCVGKYKYDPPIEYVTVALTHIKDHPNQARQLQLLLKFFSKHNLSKLNLTLCDSLVEILYQYNFPEEAEALEAKIDEVHISLDGLRKDSDTGMKGKLVEWIARGKWKEVAKYFIERGLRLKDGTVIHSVYSALIHERSKMVCNFRNFLNHIRDSKHRVDRLYLCIVGQIGTSILLEKYSEKDFQTAYKALELLHLYNINYYHLQSRYMNESLTCGFTLGNWVFQTPNGLALTAIEICLEVNAPMSAVIVLKNCNWSRTKKEWGERSSEEVTRRASLLTKLAKSLLKENEINEGVTVLTEYLDMLETDQQREDASISNVPDILELYNAYMAALVNARDVSSALKLLEYYHRMEVNLDLKGSILRALIVLCINARYQEKAEELFTVASTMGIYKKQVVSAASRPHRLCISTHLTQQEMKLVVLSYLQELHRILPKCSSTFEHRFTLHITLEEFIPEDLANVAFLQSISPALSNALDRLRNALLCDIAPALDFDVLGERILAIKPQILYGYFLQAKSEGSELSPRKTEVNIRENQLTDHPLNMIMPALTCPFSNKVPSEMGSVMNQRQTIPVQPFHRPNVPPHIHNVMEPPQPNFLTPQTPVGYNFQPEQRQLQPTRVSPREQSFNNLQDPFQNKRLNNSNFHQPQNSSASFPPLLVMNSSSGNRISELAQTGNSFENRGLNNYNFNQSRSSVNNFSSLGVVPCGLNRTYQEKVLEFDRRQPQFNRQRSPHFNKSSRRSGEIRSPPLNSVLEKLEFPGHLPFNKIHRNSHEESHLPFIKISPKVDDFQSETFRESPIPFDNGPRPSGEFHLPLWFGENSSESPLESQCNNDLNESSNNYSQKSWIQECSLKSPRHTVGDNWQKKNRNSKLDIQKNIKKKYEVKNRVLSTPRKRVLKTTVKTNSNFLNSEDIDLNSMIRTVNLNNIDNRFVPNQKMPVYDNPQSTAMKPNSTGPVFGKIQNYITTQVIQRLNVSDEKAKVLGEFFANSFWNEILVDNPHLPQAKRAEPNVMKRLVAFTNKNVIAGDN